MKCRFSLFNRRIEVGGLGSGYLVPPLSTLCSRIPQNFRLCLNSEYHSKPYTYMHSHITRHMSTLMHTHARACAHTCTHAHTHTCHLTRLKFSLPLGKPSSYQKALVQSLSIFSAFPGFIQMIWPPSDSCEFLSNPVLTPPHSQKDLVALFWLFSPVCLIGSHAGLIALVMPSSHGPALYSVTLWAVLHPTLHPWVQQIPPWSPEAANPRSSRQVSPTLAWWVGGTARRLEEEKGRSQAPSSLGNLGRNAG